MADRRVRLVNMIQRGNLAKVEQVLAAGVDLENPEISAQALKEAVSLRYQEIVELLLQRGADPNAREGKERSVLHRAAMEDPQNPVAARIVRLLVQHGADLETRDSAGDPPLFEAVRQAVHYGPMGYGYPMVIASMWPNEQGAVDRFHVIEALLDLGAKVDARNSVGVSAVGVAAEFRDEELVAALVHRGGDAEEAAVIRLHEAASEGNEESVAALLARGVSPNRRTSNGTPLSWAAQGGHLGVVNLLLAAGADPDLAESDDPDGSFNSLFRATYAGNLEVMRRLLAAGANPLARGPGGARLLDYAKMAVAAKNQRDQPWDEIMTLLREASKDGPATVGFAPLDGEPAVVSELRASFAELAAATWRRTRAGQLEFLESSVLQQAPAAWEQLREVARAHGFAPVFAGWSLEAMEPDVREVMDSLAAVDARSGRAWIEKALERWRQTAEEEAQMLAEMGEEDEESRLATLRVLESAPIERHSAPVRRLAAERCHLVLTKGHPEQVAVAYRFTQPGEDSETFGSILAAWREDTGAELVAFGRDTMDVVLPRPIDDEAEIRRRALELLVFDPDLDEEHGILRMTASRHWSFWWD